MNRTRLAPLAAVVFESRVLRTSGTAVQRRGWTGEKEKGRERERGGGGKTGTERRGRDAHRGTAVGSRGREQSDVSYE